MNDATRIIRALRKLNKLFWRYSHDDIAKALVDRGIDRDRCRPPGTAKKV
jgi:hypothetical protein